MKDRIYGAPEPKDGEKLTKKQRTAERKRKLWSNRYRIVFVSSIAIVAILGAIFSGNILGAIPAAIIYGLGYYLFATSEWGKRIKQKHEDKLFIERFMRDWFLTMFKVGLNRGDEFPTISKVTLDSNKNLHFLCTACQGLSTEAISKKRPELESTLLRNSKKFEPEDAIEQMYFEPPPAGKGASLKVTIITEALPMAGQEGAAIESVPEETDPMEVHIAKTQEGYINWNFIKDPHMAYYGTTGMGKGVGAAFMIGQVALKQEGWRIHVFCPKGAGEFAFLDGCPGVSFSETFEEHSAAFNSLIKERRRRMRVRTQFAKDHKLVDQDLSDDELPASIANWSQVTTDDAPPILIVMDEVNDLLVPRDTKPVEPKKPKEKGGRLTKREIEDYETKLELYTEAHLMQQTAESLYLGIDQAVSTWRSERLHMCLIAQRPDATGFPTRAREQLTLACVLGPLSGSGMTMAFGESEHTISVPRGPGRGIVGHRLGQDIRECQIPFLPPLITFKAWHKLWVPVDNTPGSLEYDFTSVVDRTPRVN